MADAPPEERRFSEEEVRKILKKAVERKPSQALARREGLSLAELKAIGEEVGIEPSRLEEAARSVIRGDSATPGRRFLGGATVLDFERRVPGEFQPDDTPEILSLIRGVMGHQGEVDEIHGSLEWRVKGDAGDRYVTLSPRHGSTTIRASANLSSMAVLTYLPGGMMGAVASLIGFLKFFQSGTEVGLIVGLAVLPILYPILRSIFNRVSSTEADRLEAVVDELARRLEDSADSGPIPPGTPRRT